ncbi:hypothetical protein [uncultured Roseibium sp.]|uniref:hypothetical protein n=1 Tax=uncultured Roseibium sp. TaxID=1936171 RepID=UPI002623A887|nr:hypothetical protein [uncultured Roseibium sp.]
MTRLVTFELTSADRAADSPASFLETILPQNRCFERRETAEFAVSENAPFPALLIENRQSKAGFEACLNWNFERGGYA